MTGVVALTGATGFIGRAVMAGLLDSGRQVKALVRRPAPSLEAEGVTLVVGSLEDEASLQSLVAGVDAVVHVAGAIRARSRAAFHEINAAGTANLVATAAASARKPRFLLFSSLAAREPGLSDYASSKRQAEAEMARHGSDLEWIALRPPAVYGPGDRSTLPLFQQFLRGRALVPKSGRNRVSLIHVEDLVGAVLYLLDRKPWQGEVIELDDGRQNGYAWADLAEIAAAHLGRPVRTHGVPPELLWLPAVLNETVSRLIRRAPLLTRGKLKELFHEDWVCRPLPGSALNGWQGRTTFEQGFPRTLAWYKDKGWL